VRHDAPGRVTQQGQSAHIDVDLAFVNVRDIDLYKRIVILLRIRYV